MNWFEVGMLWGIGNSISDLIAGQGASERDRCAALERRVEDLESRQRWGASRISPPTYEPFPSDASPSEAASESPRREYEHYRERCLRYLWVKTRRAISANDTGFALPVTPIMELICACRFAAQGTEELETVLGAKPDKLEALLRAIAEGMRITVVRKKAT